MALVPPPPLKTKLGRHRQLAPLAGLHVSPICLGGMSIGDQWGQLGLGQMDKESSFKLLDAFYEAGGNFIDTANNYQDETSEKFIGEWMETKGIRDQMVIATKVSTVEALPDLSDSSTCPVYEQLETPCPGYSAEDELRGKQYEVPAHLRGGVAEEAPH